MTEPDYDPAGHYDRVTAAWRLLLGEELHYGVFEMGGEPLSVATAALTDRMAHASSLAPGLAVLDVGCGTGAPACALATEFGVSVLGITTSPVGIDAASARAASAGLASRVTFELRDGTDNKLPDDSVDRVWVLESSHLMRERERLISECARVLRPGGRIALCDIIRRREIPFGEVRARRGDFLTLRVAFGDARMESLQVYSELMEREGLVVELVEDLTEATLPTFDRWRENARVHAGEVAAGLGVDGLDAFRRSTEILEGFWRDGTLGYGILAAAQPPR
ncbi:MAG: SAM-dependent methyltransferase [Solirubrobacteraceae bacterium]